MNVLLPLLLLATVPSTQRIAVYPLQTNGVATEVAATATALIPTEVRRARPGAQVVTPDDMKTMLAQQNQERMLGCTLDSGCLAELGGAIGVNEIVGGRLGRLGRFLVLELQRIDMKAQRVTASATRTTIAEEGLIDAVRVGVNELYGVTGAPAASSAALKLDKAEATFDPAQQAVAAEPTDSSELVSRVNFNGVEYRASKLKPVCDFTRKVTAEQGFAFDEENIESNQCAFRTKWRSYDRGRRIRFRLELHAFGGGLHMNYDTQDCSDLGCVESGMVSERELAAAKQLFRALFDGLESVRFK